MISQPLKYYRVSLHHRQVYQHQLHQSLLMSALAFLKLHGLVLVPTDAWKWGPTRTVSHTQPKWTLFIWNFNAILMSFITLSMLPWHGTYTSDIIIFSCYSSCYQYSHSAFEDSVWPVHPDCVPWMWMKMELLILKWACNCSFCNLLGACRRFIQLWCECTGFYLSHYNAKNHTH